MSFSTFLTVGVAVLATGASALIAPSSMLVGKEAVLSPSSKIPLVAGQANNITWSPDVEGNVALVLLIGPSNNVVPYLTIAENIPNSGSFVWTPSPDDVANLLPQASTGYGIQLVMQTGANAGGYQYSQQFGVENANSKTDYQTLKQKALTNNNNENFYTAHAGLAPATGSGAGAGTGASSRSGSYSASSSVVAPSSSAESSYNAATTLPVSSKSAHVPSAYTTSSVVTRPAPIIAYGNNATVATPAVGTAVTPVSQGFVPSTLSPVTPAVGAAHGSGVATSSASSGTGASTASGSSSSPAPFTGAASHIGASLGGLVVAAAAAVLAL